MKNRTFSPMGAMHPILFFVFVYVVALLLAIFICSSLFYSYANRPVHVLTEETGPSSLVKGPVISVSLQK